MPEADYFGRADIIDSMSAEHLCLWRSLFRACESHMTPGMRVLDFGCGNGGMLAYLMMGDGRRWPGMRCGLGLGIDRAALSPVLAEAAARLGGVLPVAFSSAPPSAFPGQFDLVMSHEVVYLLPDLEAAFRDLHASLRGGGVVAMATGCHIENALYPRWQESFARVGVRAYPYRVSDYTQALEAAGFEGIEHRSLRLALEEYDEWVATREERTPNPSWFPAPDEERRYYTEFGKALLLARRRRDDGTAASARPTSGA